MEVRKRLMATAEVDPPPRHHHRYPTRWKLRLHVPYSSLSCRPQYKAIVVPLFACKGNKRINYTRTLYLPREIIFNILLLVPAKVLHQVVRYVCKQWNDIVNDPCFIKALCQSSSSGYLIQNPIKLHQVCYIEGDNSTQIAFPFPARIHGSFNGLVLFQDLRNPQILSVINPVTKVKISLPPVPMHGVRLNAKLETVLSNISFAITTCGHYKVVVTVCAEDHYPNLHVMVFTLGIDKAWRYIDLQGNSQLVECIPRIRPRFIAGILYWCSFRNPSFAMDVDTETIFHFPMQDNFLQLFPQSSFITLGVGLGVIQDQRGNGNYSVWKLTDGKSGKWTELAGIDRKVILSTVKKELFPRKCCSCLPAMLIDDIFWFYYVVDGELAVFRFNLTNQSFVFFPVKNVFSFTQLHHHVPTLLSPKKCYP